LRLGNGQRSILGLDATHVMSSLPRLPTKQISGLACGSAKPMPHTHIQCTHSTHIHRHILSYTRTHLQPPCRPRLVHIFIRGNRVRCADGRVAHARGCRLQRVAGAVTVVLERQSREGRSIGRGGGRGGRRESGRGERDRPCRIQGVCGRECCELGRAKDSESRVSGRISAVALDRYLKRMRESAHVEKPSIINRKKAKGREKIVSETMECI
jgi:hypothetical protein